MSWTQINPFSGYYFPFYDLYHVFQLQRTAQIQNFPLKLAQNKPIEQFNNSSIETKPELATQRIEAKVSIEIKKKEMRKRKMLKKRERQDNFQRKKQKKDRNLPSNIFKYFLSYIYSSNPTVQSIRQSLQEKKIHINISSFLIKLREAMKQSQSYIRGVIIQNLCGDNILDRNESLYFRLLLKRFLLLDLAIVIFPMPKYKKRQKRQIISMGKRLFALIKQKIFE